MNLVSWILVVQIFSCWFMTGVIWLVQILVYPSFSRVGENELRRYHAFHLNRITWIVAPMMGLERISAIALLVMRFDFPFMLNLGSILILWLLTGVVNVPAHDRLVHSHEAHDTLKMAQLN